MESFQQAQGVADGTGGGGGGVYAAMAQPHRQTQTKAQQPSAALQSFEFHSSIVDRPYGGSGGSAMAMAMAADSSRLSLPGAPADEEDEDDEFAGEVSGIVGRPAAAQGGYGGIGADGYQLQSYAHTHAHTGVGEGGSGGGSGGGGGSWLPSHSYAGVGGSGGFNLSPMPLPPYSPNDALLAPYPAAQSVPSGVPPSHAAPLPPAPFAQSTGANGGGQASPTAGGSMDVLQRQVLDMRQQQQLQQQHNAYLQQLEQQQQMQRLLQQQQHIQQQQQQLYLQQQQLHLRQPQVIPPPQPPPPPMIPAAPFPTLSSTPTHPGAAPSPPPQQQPFARGSSGGLHISAEVGLSGGVAGAPHSSASHTPSRKRSRVGSLSHGLGLGPGMVPGHGQGHGHGHMPERPFSAAASFRSLEPDNRAEHGDRQAAYMRMYKQQQQQQAAAGQQDDDMQQMLKRCRSASPVFISQQQGTRSMTHSYSAMAAAAAATSSSAAAAAAPGADAASAGASDAPLDPSLKRPTMHRRRRTEELLPHETWQCPYSDPATSLPCGKTYRTSSSRSIHKHALHCKLRPPAGSASAEALSLEKRKQKKRRKSYELAAHERWNCPFGCGRFFRTTSTKSIHLHRSTCPHRPGGPVQPEQGDADEGDEELRAKLRKKEMAKLSRARNRQLQNGSSGGQSDQVVSPPTHSTGTGGGHHNPGLRIQLDAPPVSLGASQSLGALSSPTRVGPSAGAGGAGRRSGRNRFSSGSDSSSSSSDSDDERDDDEAEEDDDEEREERKLLRAEEAAAAKRRQSPLDPQLQVLGAQAPLQLSSHVVDAIELPSPSLPLPLSTPNALLLPLTPPVRRMSFDDLYPTAAPPHADVAAVLQATPTHDDLTLPVLPATSGASHDIIARLQRENEMRLQQSRDDAIMQQQQQMHLQQQQQHQQQQQQQSLQQSLLQSPSFLPATLYPSTARQQSSDSGASSSAASVAELAAASTAQQIQSIQSQLRLIQHMQKQAQSEGAVSSSNVDAMQRLHDSIEMATQQLAADQQQQFLFAQQQQQQHKRTQIAASSESEAMLRMLLQQQQRQQEGESRLDSGGSNGSSGASIHPHDLSRPSSSASMRELASDMSNLQWQTSGSQQLQQPQPHANQLGSYPPIYAAQTSSAYSLGQYGGGVGGGSSGPAYTGDLPPGSRGRLLGAQLADHDRWTCTNGACGKFFKKSSTNSIRRHALACLTSQHPSSSASSAPFSPTAVLRLIAAGMPPGGSAAGGGSAASVGLALSVDLDEEQEADDVDDDDDGSKLEPHAIDQQMFPAFNGADRDRDAAAAWNARH